MLSQRHNADAAAAIPPFDSGYSAGKTLPVLKLR
jgi:hypothetical protein